MALEDRDRRPRTGGDAMRALIDFSKQRPGQIDLVDAVRKAADRGGVRQQVDELRMLDPLQSLRDKMGVHKPAHAAPPQTAYGALSAAGDALMLRGAYPGLKALGNPGGPIRSGQAGRFNWAREQEKDKRP